MLFKGLAMQEPLINFYPKTYMAKSYHFQAVTSHHYFFLILMGFFSSQSYDTQSVSISNNAKYRLTHAGHGH